MRIAVLGPGAVGCTFGAYLHRAGHEVVFLHRDARRAAALARAGIRVDGVRGPVKLATPRVVADASEVGPVELVLVSAKAYDGEEAVRRHRAVVGPRTVLLTFQNGLGNVEAIAAVVGPGRVLAGTTTHGVHRLGPGRVRHAGEGDTYLGEPEGGRITARARRVSRLFGEAGIRAGAVADMPERLWTKLAVNAGINALTALLRVRNGVLLERPESRAILEAAAAEAAEVARAVGVRVEVDGLVERARETARRTAANRSSMLADVLAGRPTEVDWINGAVAERGRGAGVATPVNGLLHGLVRALERTGAAREA